MWLEWIIKGDPNIENSLSLNQYPSSDLPALQQRLIRACSIGALSESEWFLTRRMFQLVSQWDRARKRSPDAEQGRAAFMPLYIDSGYADFICEFLDYVDQNREQFTCFLEQIAKCDCGLTPVPPVQEFLAELCRVG